LRYLLDTNVVSELRKGEKADEGVRDWLEGVDDEELFVSVLVIGEIRKGIESVRRRDEAAATNLESWLSDVVTGHADRILPITSEVAQAWGRLNVPDPLPVIDSLIATTAHVHGLTVVTRNTSDVARAGVDVLNPFGASPPPG
jgi:predicted nucleic acid-binding protein